MSLDVYLDGESDVEIWSSNVTHNLRGMADAVGLYGIIWRPEENGITRASEMIEPLEKGIAKLKADPEKFGELNPNNGWGSYERFIPWLEEYLAACRNTPYAKVRASR